MALHGEKVCIFEASDRVGGRTFSQQFQAGSMQENYVLDVGAYRFSPDMHLPGDIILKVLELPVACYEPSCPPAYTDFPPPFKLNCTSPLVRIVDIEGMPAGYVTALHGMIDRIQASGGQLFTGARLMDLIPNGDSSVLVFGDIKVSAKKVMLNFPRTSILSLPSLQSAIPARTTKMQTCVKFDLPADFFPPGQHLDLGNSLSKAYAFYEDAWWRSVLDKAEGQWPTNAFVPIQTSVGIPIGIHFNDGPVRCNADGKGCRGFLEVYYAASNETFFENLRVDSMHPLGALYEKDDSHGMLPRLHQAVMEATKSLFDDAGKAQPEVAPSLLVVGIWDRKGEGYTAPTKVYYSTASSLAGGPDPLEKACGVPGLTEEEYRKSILMPFGTPNVLVANNDWVAMETERLNGDWAMESLLQAERGLKLLGLDRPEWLDEDYYAFYVTPYVEAMQQSSVVTFV